MKNNNIIQVEKFENIINLKQTMDLLESKKN